MVGEADEDRSRARHASKGKGKNSNKQGQRFLSTARVLPIRPTVPKQHKIKSNVHLGQLGGGSVSDLLDSELGELGLELDQLLGEVGLVLGDELVSADFAGSGRHGDCRAKSIRSACVERAKGDPILKAKFPALVWTDKVC